MNLPRPMMKAVEAIMKAADARSYLGMAEGGQHAHDSLYRALEVGLEQYFKYCLALLKRLGGLHKGYLILDDVVIARWQRGLLNLPKVKDGSSHQYVWGFCVWMDSSASKELMRKIHGLGWSFVTRLRKNGWMVARLDTMDRPSGSKRASSKVWVSWSRCPAEVTPLLSLYQCAPALQAAEAGNLSHAFDHRESLPRLTARTWSAGASSSYKRGKFSAHLSPELYQSYPLVGFPGCGWPVLVTAE